MTTRNEKKRLPDPGFWLPMLVALGCFWACPAAIAHAKMAAQRQQTPSTAPPSGMAGPQGGQSPGNVSLTPETNLQTGIQLTQSARFGDAIPYLLAARGQIAASEEFAADFDLSLCYVATGQYQKAIPLLTELAKQHPGTANVENLLAQAYIGAQQPEKAYEALRRAAAIDPRNEKLYVLVADACTDSRAYALGLKVVDLGLHALPNSARLHYERGVFLSELERSDLATQEFRLAAKYGSGMPIGSMGAAQVAFLEGNMPQTIAAAREGLRKSPDNYILLAILGQALVRSGASPGQPPFAEALKAMEKAVAEQPDHAGSQITLAKLYLTAGRLDKAIAHLEKARQLDPRNTSVYSHLAIAYRKQGNLSKAREMLAMLARLNEQQAQSIRNGSSGKHKSYVSSGMAQAPPDIPHLF
jgi:predicted Zn-dependent protease